LVTVLGRRRMKVILLAMMLAFPAGLQLPEGARHAILAEPIDGHSAVIVCSPKTHTSVTFDGNLPQVVVVTCVRNEEGK
jgi:hypothetical protein